jgi:hypothetical protein
LTAPPPFLTCGVEFFPSNPLLLHHRSLSNLMLLKHFNHTQVTCLQFNVVQASLTLGNEQDNNICSRPPQVVLLLENYRTTHSPPTSASNFLPLSSTAAKHGPASSNYCAYFLHLITLLLLAFTSSLQCNSNRHPNYFLSSTSGHPRSQCMYI